MLGHFSQAAQKHRSTKFVPSFSANASGGLLEARALTAPAIFRRPPTDLLSLQDKLTADASGQATDDGLNTASNHGQVTNGTTTGSATSAINAIDLVNPSPPADPIGTAQVSFGASDQNMITGTGSGGGVSLTSGTRFLRHYVLADTDLAGDSGASVTERFTVDYLAPAISGNTLGVGIATPGLTIGVAFGTGWTVNIGGANGAGNVGIFNTVTNGRSGTITLGSEVINYSVTANFSGVSLTVTETSPVGALPGAGTNPDGTGKGLAWTVDYDDTMILTGNMSDSDTLTTSYQLDISANP